MMRIGFVDHSYHKQTGSTQFFLDEIFPGALVTRLWDDGWQTGAPLSLESSIEIGSHDCIVIFQSEIVATEAARLLKIHPTLNLVFVPMWDSCRGLPDEFWSDLAGLKIVAFSRILHERVTRLGMFSYYSKYFPVPGKAKEVERYGDPSAFFWYRRPEIGWPEVRSLVGTNRLARLHLHLAPDPLPATVRTPPESPTPQDVARFNITTSEWLENASDLHAIMAQANIVFAPRPSEGIGQLMLEAMAAGACVVANDDATMNEYIVSGVNGLLYDLRRPAQLDLSDYERLGRRAREHVGFGREAWLADLPALRDFVTQPRESGPIRPTGAVRFQDSTPAASRQAESTRAGPRVSVVTVVRNAAESIEMTMRNVATQDYPNLEYLVVDGRSTDGTIDLIKAHEVGVTRWVSEPDQGPYDAMNKAADLATGEYIIFMNAGDWFHGSDAVSRALRGAPADADFIIGHHIYRVSGLDEQLHRAADFEETWSRLRAGDVDASWLQGIPGHQATLTRTALLRENRYDIGYRIAADHEFMYRMREQGARFHHCLEILAVYPAGGLSQRHQRTLFKEWLRIVQRYGGPGAQKYIGSLFGFRRAALDLVGKAVKIAKKTPVWRLRRPAGLLLKRLGLRKRE